MKDWVQYNYTQKQLYICPHNFIDYTKLCPSLMTLNIVPDTLNVIARLTGQIPPLLPTHHDPFELGSTVVNHQLTMNNEVH
jgi:hypothetical protein